MSELWDLTEAQRQQVREAHIEAGRAGSDQDQAVTGRSVIGISRPVKERLAMLKDARQWQLRRQVTYTEVIEELLDRAGAA